MDRRKVTRYAGVGAVCAALGAAGGIAEGSAAPHAQPARGGVRLGRVVHADVVVATAGGTRFARLTIDRGIVRSVSGNELAIAEGTPKATYRSVTLTIPPGAVVRNNGSAAPLASLKAGERVAVRQGPRATHVVARAVRGR